MTFSVKTLMVCTLILAVSLGLYPILGTDLFLWLGFTLFIYAGAESHRVKQPRPFWMSAGALAILHYLQPPLGYRPSELDVVVNSIVFTSGACLAYAGTRYGHWSSRLLAGVILVPYMLFFSFCAYRSYLNWNSVVRYWGQ